MGHSSLRDLKTIGKDMKERIILYGCGEEAKRFYLQNYNKYEIAFAIDKNAETLRLFYRVPVFVLDEARSKIRDT